MQPVRPITCTTNVVLPEMSSANDEAAALLGLLQRVQAEALRALGPEGFDPKLYVDLPLAADRGAVEAALERLPRPAATPEEMEAFLAEYFAPAGSDVVAASPPDFAAQPPGFLPGVESPEARAWALAVHALWKDLARRVALAPDVERHTLLPLPGWVVVPGSRFREVYYWDTYWVVRGLLVSKMYDTAKGIVLNLVYLVEKYGFVLNGARTYYTNRSQPPLLSSMVLDVYMATNDLGFVRRAFPSLLKEHSFWMSDIHNVQIRDNEGRIHNLSRYQAIWNKPRPESATIDEELASNLSSASDKEKLYHQIASAAESGWDFSSRWMSDSSDLRTLRATSIIPVDLNTFICKMERDIAFFSELVGGSITSEKFFEASKARQTAIDSIFWNSEMEQWLDYWLPNDGTYEGVHQWKANSQNHKIFASNFVPLWLNAHRSGCAPFVDEIRSVRVIQSFQRSGLLQAAGIATSLSNTGQQWDFPNGWAPIQHLIVEGLVNCGSAEARNVAKDIATRWVRTNAAAYMTTGAMHEKYDVEVCGKSGGGGEYKPQTGFGWSNGVILALFEEFGWPQDKQIGPMTAYDTS